MYVQPALLARKLNQPVATRESKKNKNIKIGPKKTLVLFVGGGQNHWSKARLLGFKNIPKNPNLETARLGEITGHWSTQKSEWFHKR